MNGTPLDLKALDDDEFTDHERAVKMDRERRDNLARIPDTITDLSRAYTESGGDAADLVDALSPEQVAALDA